MFRFNVGQSHRVVQSWLDSQNCTLSPAQKEKISCFLSDDVDKVITDEAEAAWLNHLITGKDVEMLKLDKNGKDVHQIGNENVWVNSPEGQAYKEDKVSARYSDRDYRSGQMSILVDNDNDGYADEYIRYNVDDDKIKKSYLKENSLDLES